MARVLRNDYPFIVMVMVIGLVGRVTLLCQMFDLKFIAGYGGQD